MQLVRTTSTPTEPQGNPCMFGLPSPMELVVVWGGRRRVFQVLEFAVDEIVVVDFDVEGLDLRHHEATLDFCDGEILDEVHCKVALRRFEDTGVARLRVVASGWELMELARLAEQIADAHRLEQVRVAAACGWI